MTLPATGRPRAVVVGAGIMGVTAALELHRRGWRVRLLDAGPIPNPLAGSAGGPGYEWNGGWKRRGVTKTCGERVL